MANLQPRPPVAPPPREAWQRPDRVEPVPDTPFGLAIFGPPTAVSGPAIGSLIAGTAGVLVSFTVTCFGLAGARAGWGLMVAGAFAMLTGFLGAVAIGLGAAGIRQTRRPVLTAGGAEATGVGTAPAAVVGGRGMAVGGLICGVTALALTLISVAATLAIQLTA